MAKSSSTLLTSRDRSELADPPGSASVAIFARQVLVFPLLVVILACASFLFGGTCAAWQWWMAVAAVVLVPFIRHDRLRAALGAAGLFALLLFALRCLIPPMTWDDNTCVDMPVYHLPMIQLLIEGWNPVSDTMAEEITTSLGLDLWGMAPLHVAFLPKTMAVFSAVAYTFVRDPYALTFPLPAFLWLGVFLYGVRIFRGFSRWALAAALIFVLPMVAWRMPLDLCLAFSSCGLLLTIQNALRGKKCDWLALAVWTSWMMNLKFNGVLGAFVFCAAFAAATIWKNRTGWKRWISRFAAFGGVLILLWGLISWNPLGTSWRTYGHPLYPFKTVDCERFPVKDLTWDLQGENDDFFKMGKLELMAYAYIAPESTIRLHRRLLRAPEFNPSCVWWHAVDFPGNRARLGIWALFVALFLLPSGRLFAIGGMILLLLVPNHMIGYTRYQPWLSALGCLALVYAAEWAENRLSPCLRNAGIFVTAFSIVCYLALGIGGKNSSIIECKAKENAIDRQLVVSSFWPPPIAYYRQSFFCSRFVPRYHYLRCMGNHAKLLFKELGKERETSVLSPEVWESFLETSVEWDERNWHSTTKTTKRFHANETRVPADARRDDAETTSQQWHRTPFCFFVSENDHYSHIEEYYNNISSGDLCWSKALRSWFVTYPKEVFKRAVETIRPTKETLP